MKDGNQGSNRLLEIKNGLLNFLSDSNLMFNEEVDQNSYL